MWSFERAIEVVGAIYGRELLPVGGVERRLR